MVERFKDSIADLGTFNKNIRIVTGSIDGMKFSSGDMEAVIRAKKMRMLQVLGFIGSVFTLMGFIW